MTPDEILRSAARLLRQGAPVEEFVGALDGAARQAIADHAMRRPMCFKCHARSAGEPPRNNNPVLLCCCHECHRVGGNRIGAPCPDCPHTVPA